MAVCVQTQCVVYIANKTYKFTKSLHTYFFSTLYMYVYSDRKSGMYVYTECYLVGIHKSIYPVCSQYSWDNYKYNYYPTTHDELRGQRKLELNPA